MLGSLLRRLRAADGLAMSPRPRPASSRLRSGNYLPTHGLRLFLLGLLGCHFSFAQNSGFNGTGVEHRVIPPSPTAAALGNFGNIPTDLNAGVATVNIPIVEVKGRQLSVPVSLNYRTTGIRVDEAASWVGLGWVLDAGGVITRTVRGLPDERANAGYFESWAQVASSIGGFSGMLSDHDDQYKDENNLLRTTLSRVITGEADVEPDAFSYNFAGKSGSIYFTFDHRPVFAPYREWKVSLTNFYSGNYPVWRITTEDGIQYMFGEQFRDSHVTPGGNSVDTAPVYSAWHLESIISADRKDTIRLEYTGNDLVTASPLMRVSKIKLTNNQTSGSCDADQVVYNQDPDFSDGYGHTSSTIGTCRLQRIETSTARLTLYADSTREDIAAGDPNVPKLTELKLLDKVTGLSRTFRLHYNYFDGSDKPTANSSSNPPQLKRLRLLSFGEEGKPAYQFFYNSRPLPARDSFSRDHWGFFNNATNASLLPVPPRSAHFSTSAGGSSARASRRADGVATQVGMLEKVVYPTGGSTSFSYEGNYVNTYAPVDMFGEPLSSGDIIVQLAVSGGPDLQGGTPITPGDTISQAILDMYSGGGPGEGSGGHQQRSNGGFSCNSWDTSLPGHVYPAPQTRVQAKLLTLPLGATQVMFAPVISSPGSSMQAPCGVYLSKLNEQDGINSAKTGKLVEFSNQYAGPLTTAAYSSTCPATKIDDLVPGVYVLYVITNATKSRVSVTLQYHTPDIPVQMRPIGGVRLRQTVDHPLIGPDVVTNYDYRQVNAAGEPLPGTSSAALFYQPVYDQRTPCGNTLLAAYDQQVTGSLLGGYHMGYQHVTVTKQGGATGRTLYQYLNSGPAESRSLLLTQWDYSAAGQLVHQVQNEYLPPQNETPLLDSYRIFISYIHARKFSATSDARPIYYFSQKRERFGYAAPTKKVETSYEVGAPTASPLTRTTIYQYGLNAQGHYHAAATTIKEVVGPGDTLLTATRYPADYDTLQVSTPAAQSIRTLLRDNVQTAPIEQVRYRQSAASLRVLGGSVQEYAQRQPRRSFQLDLAAPLAATSFMRSAIQGGAFQKDGRYREAWSFDLYNPAGNLLQQHRPGAATTSYVWGYQETEPIAEARNAAPTQIAYTSFEPGATGRWEYDSLASGREATHFTGRYSYRLQDAAPVYRRGLPAGAYEVMLWAHGTNTPVLEGATQQQHTLLATAGYWRQHLFRIQVPANGTLTLKPGGGTTWIDELRLYPLGAQMTSYTYDPLLGMTSQTDATGRTMSYEYDAQGRLVRTRDEQGRLLTQQQYHYARP